VIVQLKYVVPVYVEVECNPPDGDDEMVHRVVVDDENAKLADDGHTVTQGGKEEWENSPPEWLKILAHDVAEKSEWPAWSFGW
jgi:hypothetical protein